MRQLAIGIVVMALWPAVGQGQEPPLDKLRIALQQPAPIRGTIPLTLALPPVARRLGPLTLVPPEMKGEFVRVSLPVGELITRAVDHIRTAAMRRQESAARREVDAALKRYLETASHPER